MFDHVPQSYLICASHFDVSDIVRNGRRVTLKPNAVPQYFP